MSDITEAIGTATEGGLFARIIGGNLTDKDGNPLKKGHFTEGTCLNCGAELLGAHCHQCGQKAHLHRTIGAFLHDLMHGALHLDGKVWRTLPMLIRKPGELTRRYIDGERVRFVSPMAMFLFSVFLMFAVFQMVGLTAPTTVGSSNNVEQALVEVRESAESKRDRLAEQIATLPEDTPAEERDALEKELEGAEAGLKGLDEVQTMSFAKDGWTMNLTGIKSIDEGILKKWRENPSLMLYKLQSNGYKFSWLLIPLSIPFVWMTFAWRRRFKAYDHAIFVTYSLAFMSLLFIALSALSAAGIGGGWIFFALAVIAPIHIYKHLRYGYDISRFSAIWRLFALLFFIVIILTMFLQLLLLIGAF